MGGVQCVLSYIQHGKLDQSHDWLTSLIVACNTCNCPVCTTMSCLGYAACLAGSGLLNFMDTSNCRSLKLQGCYRITDSGMKTVADNFKHLTTLDISNCKGLTEQCISHVARIDSLRNLTVVGIPLSSEVYTQLPKHFPYLNRLALTAMITHAVDITSLMSNTKVTVHMPK